MKTAEKMRWVGQPLEMGDSLTRYLQEISYHELLTADEEVELAQAIEAGTAAEEQLAAVSVRGAEKVRLQRAARKGGGRHDNTVIAAHDQPHEVWHDQPDEADDSDCGD